MWNIQSTTRLLKEMSQASEPGILIRLFFDHIRRSGDVKRALVLSSAGLSSPQYRLVHNVTDELIGPDLFLNELRQDGLLSQLLYRGEFQSINSFAPDASDPAFDVLEGG